MQRLDPGLFRHEHLEGRRAAYEGTSTAGAPFTPVFGSHLDEHGCHVEGLLDFGGGIRRLRTYQSETDNL